MAPGPEPGRDRLDRPDRVAVGDQRDDVGRRLGAELLQERRDPAVQPGQALAALGGPVRIRPVDDVPELTGRAPLEDAVALLPQRRGDR